MWVGACAAYYRVFFLVYERPAISVFFRILPVFLTKTRFHLIFEHVMKNSHIGVGEVKLSFRCSEVLENIYN